MKIKTDIEIVTGFLGSGKTKFINALIENTLDPKEKVVIIQCENGENSISEKIINTNQVRLIEYKPTEMITYEVFMNIINKYNPNRIIIEHNGSRRLKDLLITLDEKELKSISNISSIFYITDACNFNLYMNNMIGILQDSINLSDLIIVHNTAKISKEYKDIIRNKVTILNSRAYILEIPNIDDLEYILKKENILDNGIFKKLRIFLRNLK